MKGSALIILALAVFVPVSLSTAVFNWNVYSNFTSFYTDVDSVDYVHCGGFWVEITEENKTFTYTPVYNLSEFSPINEKNPSSNSSFYATANHCFFLESQYTCNGSNWTNLTEKISDIAYGNNVYLLLSENKTVIWKANGNFSNITVVQNLTSAVASIEFVKDTFYIFGTSGIVGQYHNHTYNVTDYNFPANLSSYGLIHGDKVWVGLLKNFSIVSTSNTSAIGNTASTNISVTNTSVYDFGFYAGYFIILNDNNGNPIYSTDGLDWTEMAPSSANLTIDAYVGADQLFYSWTYNKTTGDIFVYTASVDFIPDGNGLSWWIIVISLIGILVVGVAVYLCIMNSYKYHSEQGKAH